MRLIDLINRAPIVVRPSDPIDRAINQMEVHGDEHAVVVLQDRPVGMVSNRDILIATGWMLGIERRAHGEGPGGKVLGPQRIEQIMSRPLHSVTMDSSVRDVAALMADHKISAVPVLDGARLVGVITDSDLLDGLKNLASLPGPAADFLSADVSTLMSSPVISVSPDTLLDDIVAIFRRFHVRHVPVVVRQILHGIISDRDIRRAVGWSNIRDMQAEAQGRLATVQLPSTAGQIMQEDVATVLPQTTLRDAVQSMETLRIHSLPVVQGDQLVGMITQTDFVKAIARGEAVA